VLGAIWVTGTSAVFQSNVVAHYQQYTDGSEAKFGFGQIFCMAAITKPVYDLYQYGKDDSQRAHLFIPRWRLWKSQCISLIKPFNYFRSRFVFRWDRYTSVCRSLSPGIHLASELHRMLVSSKALSCLSSMVCTIHNDTFHGSDTGG
jgi:hypothetical protein